jgi:GH24 family phage-related lysozyme (muramidase)
MSNKVRAGIAGLVLSAAGFIGIISSEGYTDTAVIPTKNDRPTIGHGSTVWEDGKPVKMGDKITPVRALFLAQDHLAKEEIIFRQSLPGVQLYQTEYDVYINWTYQYGTGAWSKSSMRSNLLIGNYSGACKALLLYKFSGGYDCSVPGNKVCSGVWTRQIARYNQCMGAQ